MKRLTVVGVALLIALVATGCGFGGRGDSGYHITAYFEKAVSLYPHSKVKLMGMSVGTVDSVKVDGSRVRVDMTIDNEVPLPLDVNATINALTIIGERNVQLGPPWKPGAEKAPDGFVIPVEHTVTPIEPDDGLKAFRDLAESLDPAVISSIITSGANTFGGHEQGFNDLLDGTATLTSRLAAQDDRIIEAANNLHQLAEMLNSREQQLGHVIDGFSQASGALAAEREQISALLSGANRLVNAGTSLLGAYQGQLPGDLANLSSLGLVLQANAGTFEELLAAFPAVGQGLLDAYDPAANTLRLSANAGPSLAGILEATLGRLLDPLGLGDLIRCLEILTPCE